MPQESPTITSRRESDSWDRRDAALLAGVLSLAAALRFFHLGQGLPEVVYVDAVRYVGEALRILEPGAYLPRMLDYPSGYMGLLAAIYRVFGIESRLATHLVARVVSALFGLGVVAWVYWAARREAGRAAATLGALLAAVCAVHLTAARTENTDAMSTFLAALALGLMAGPRPGWPRWIAIGLASGAACATKYNALALGPMMAAVALYWGWRRGDRARTAAQFAAAAACVPILVAISSPWILQRIPECIDALKFQAETQRTGQIGRIQLGWLDYFISTTPTWEQPWLSTSLAWTWGWPLLAGFLAALALAAARRLGHAASVYALFILGFFALTLGPGHVKAIRYLLPIFAPAYVIVAILAARGIDRLRLPRSSRIAAFAVAAVALAAFPAWKSARYLRASARPLSNEIARAWMKENIPDRSVVYFSPFFIADLADPRLQSCSPQTPAGRQYRMKSRPAANSELSPVYHPELIDDMRAAGVRYVALNSWYDDAYSAVPENLRWFPVSTEGYRAFRARLAAESDPLFEAKGFEEGRLGPTIRIYRLK